MRPARKELNSGDSLLLVTAFAKALAHRIRTPLAVVTNELSFLTSQGHDCGRAVQRAKDIAEILKVACMLGSTSDERSAENDTTFKLTSALRKTFPQLAEHPFTITTDAMYLEATLRLIARLMNDISGDEREYQHEVTLCADSEHAHLDLACQLHDPIDVQGSVHSLTKLFSSKLHLDLIEPPLIDAGAQRCEIEITASLSQGRFNLRCTWNAAH